MSVESRQFDEKARLLDEVRRIADRRFDATSSNIDRGQFVELVAQLFDPTGGLVTSTSPQDLAVSLIQKATESLGT
jgi:hypothetical protein